MRCTYELVYRLHFSLQLESMYSGQRVSPNNSTHYKYWGTRLNESTMVVVMSPTKDKLMQLASRESGLKNCSTNYNISDSAHYKIAIGVVPTDLPYEASNTSKCRKSWAHYDTSGARISIGLIIKRDDLTYASSIFLSQLSPIFHVATLVFIVTRNLCTRGSKSMPVSISMQQLRNWLMLHLNPLLLLLLCNAVWNKSGSKVV